MSRHVFLAALAVAVACGAPQESASRARVSTADTMAAFGHTPVDTTGLAAAKDRATISMRQLDSQNAAIRERNRGTKLPPPKRVERRMP